MSRFLDIKIAIFFVMFLLTCCKSNVGNYKNNYTENVTLSSLQEGVRQNLVDDDIKKIQDKDDSVDAGVSLIKDDATSITNEILKHPTKKLNIAIVAPMTGQYGSIGNMIAESALFTLNKSRFKNTATINIYNIENLSDAKWEDNTELQRLIKDKNDFIIGSGKNFENTTKKILSLLPEDCVFISFINNYDLAKQYPNLIVLGFEESYKIYSLFQYLKDYKRQFLSLILPATNKGYNTDKLFRKLAPMYEMYIINSQFYQPKSQASIRAATRGISKNLVATYLVDENGALTTETYKQNQEKKRKNKQTNDAQNDDSSSQDLVQTVDVNAIYIDGGENDLLTTLNYLDKFGVLNKNIQVFSNAVFDIDKASSKYLDNILYIGYNYSIIDLFNKNFKLSFGNVPNYFSYLTYDTLSMLFYASNFGDMLPTYLFSTNGFRGLLDEFRLSRDGNIERRVSIYSFKNSIMQRIFIPMEYSSLDFYKDNNLK